MTSVAPSTEGSTFVKKLIKDAPESSLVQVPRAFIASVCAAVVDVGLYTLSVKLLSVWPVLASAYCYLIGGLVQWYACSRWVFVDSRKEEEKKGFKDMVFFYLLSLGGLAITMATVYILHNRLFIDPVVAKIAALGLAFFWNFLSRKFFIFERNQVNGQ